MILDLTHLDPLKLVELLDRVHVEWKEWAYKNWWKTHAACDVEVRVSKLVYETIPHIPGTAPLVLHGWLGTITVVPIGGEA